MSSARTSASIAKNPDSASGDDADRRSVDTADDSNTRAAFEEALKRLNAEYKTAKFKKALADEAKQLYELLKKLPGPETASYWKASTLVYELNDIFYWDETINQYVFTNGQKAYNELRGLSLEYETSKPSARFDKQMVLEKVLYCACYGNELRRRGQPEAAAQLFDWLLTFTTETLATSNFLCLGTRARLSYHLGYVYRVLERHSQAEAKFTQTLDLLFERAKTHKDDSDRLLITRRQAMAVGIGYGWINATRGFLQRAENALSTARSLLAGINDPVVPSFIELLYGSIKRCRAGTNRTKLERAVESMKVAKRSFEKQGHRRHITRACWELSLAYNLLGNFADAEKNLKEVEQYAQTLDHAKWQINVSILRSRLLRNQGDLPGARAHAEDAVRRAVERKSVLPLTDAYITRGEAFFKTIEAGESSAQSYELARKDFATALEVISTLKGKDKNFDLPSNPKIVAVCELRIAQCFARDGDERKARLHFATWEMLRPNVEHEWVRELAEEVKGEIEDMVHNFTISAQDPNDWNYARNVAQLRSWLLSQSLRHTNRNYSAAANLIGVKRGTLYQWQDDSRSLTQRARTKVKE